MTAIFLRLFNLSITAGWIVAAVLLLRPLLQKAPRWIHCLLWAIVALRLLLPFSLESGLSLVPSPEVIPQDIVFSETPAIHSGIPVINSAVNPLFTLLTPTVPYWRENLLLIAAGVWAAGFLVMQAYGLITWLRLRLQVRICIPGAGNIRFCDDIGSPFILGVFRPRIYIPSGLSPECLPHVLAHEQAHLRRRDHWWKPLGFWLLTVYWFNPLFWVAYILLCKDIEQACDQRVIRELDLAGKKEYSKALLACSLRRRTVMSCPVAFGEVSVKTRIRDVMRYQKPGFRIVLGAALLCALLAVCFLTDPVPCDHQYLSETAQAATCTRRGIATVACTECGHSYTTHTPRLSHSYDEGSVTVQPTCTSQGTRIYACTGCGREHRETLAKLPHIPGQPVTVRTATCAETGLQETRCILCDCLCATLTLAATQEHTLVEEVLRESTCARNGEGIRKCQFCDYSETLGYPKPEHRYKEIGWSYGTCSDTGTITMICLDCDRLHRVFLPRDPNVHVWGEVIFCRYCNKPIEEDLEFFRYYSQ